MNTLTCIGLFLCLAVVYASALPAAVETESEGNPESVAAVENPEKENLEEAESRWGYGGGWGYGGRGWGGGYGGWGGGYGGWRGGGWGGYGGGWRRGGYGWGR